MGTSIYNRTLPTTPQKKISLFPHLLLSILGEKKLPASYSRASYKDNCPCFYLYVFSFSGFLFIFESSTAQPEHFFHSYLQISGKYFINNKAALQLA